MDARFAAKAELARQGADGWIDRLVLNAIAQYDDAATALRTITSWRGYWMSTELTVFEDDGHIRCHGKDPSGDAFGWNRDTVTIHGRPAPETILTALIGRPVSKLIEHPVLSDDIVITEASNDTRFGLHSIRATFEQPRLLFRSASGRVWLPGDA